MNTKIKQITINLKNDKKTDVYKYYRNYKALENKKTKIKIENFDEFVNKPLFSGLEIFSCVFLCMLAISIIQYFFPLSIHELKSNIFIMFLMIGIISLINLNYKR